MMEQQLLRVCVVGAGTRFLSGISYYTLRLVNALAPSHEVSAILMRQLLPTALYPGRKRVGASLTRLAYAPAARIFDGLDWHWLPSLFRALAFLTRRRPEVLVLQWWSGTVLHSYLALVLTARLLGARLVIEFHEVLDTGEARLFLAQAYVRLVAPLIVRLAHGFVVHSVYDHQLLEERYRLGQRPVALIPLGPFNHHQVNEREPVYRAAPAECCNLLYFGVIRPYKGLEDLIRAFDAIPVEEVNKYWLTIVGETWEGWTLPAELIARSPLRHRITFVNRYVPDEEVAQYFGGADAVVLPYHRSSASGPLHVAMSHGLPIVVTRVGGLVEAIGDYEGAVLVPPKDPVALGSALVEVAQKRGQRFADPHSWVRTVERFDNLFDVLRQHSGAVETVAC